MVEKKVSSEKAAKGKQATKKADSKKAAGTKIVVRQTRSHIARPKRQIAVLQSLGLGRIGSSAVHNSTPDTLGMIRAVAHMVEIETVG